MIEKLIRNTIPSLLILSTALFLGSCNDDDDDNGSGGGGNGTESIYTELNGNSNFSILKEIVDTTGLAVTLQEGGPYTVFAPTNDAFESFFNLENIDDIDSDGSRVDDLINTLGIDAVRETLRYHILAGEIIAADIPESGYFETASTSSPGGHNLSLLLEERPSGYKVKGRANIINIDIAAANGVVHSIDEVLRLPTVLDHVLDNAAQLSELVNALIASGLNNTLEIENQEFTLFAPNNEAFNEAGNLPTMAGDLQNLINYHIYSEQIRSSQLTTGPLMMRNDQTLDIAIGTNVVLTDTEANSATVITTDIQGTNGVIHIIEEVLIPQF